MLSHLAKLSGKMKCCSRGACIHRQASEAMKKIEKLEARNKWLEEKHNEMLDGYHIIEKQKSDLEIKIYDHVDEMKLISNLNESGVLGRLIDDNISKLKMGV